MYACMQRGVQNVCATAGDFAEVDPHSPTYASVTHVLLDPSCSSSGMSARPTTDPAEIAALVRNQIRLIQHAMSFPRVDTIVYSTCSVHRCENEEVVEHVLAASGGRWRAVAALPWWRRRGLQPASCARACVRSTLQDQTIGFFLCRLERVEAASDADSRPVPSAGAAAVGDVGAAAAVNAAAMAMAPGLKQRHCKRNGPAREGSSSSRVVAAGQSLEEDSGAPVIPGLRKEGKKKKKRKRVFAVVEEVL
jgi:hypothetical protein